MNQNQWLKPFEGEQNTATAAGYVLVWVMMLAFLWLIVGVGEQISPEWRGSYMIWFGGLLVFEAMFISHIVKERSDRANWYYRVSEWLTILVGLKLVIFISQGFSGVWQEVSGWQQSLLNFFDGEYLISLMIIIIVWFLSNRFGNQLRNMHSYESDLEIGQFIQLRSERVAARQEMINQFLTVGVFMIFLATTARLDFQAIGGMQGQRIAMPLSFSVVPIIIFFVAGLILLSLTHFAILRGSWLMGKVNIQEDIARNWLRFAAIIFGAAAIIALLLPTSYTVNFLETAIFVVQLLIELAMFIIGLLVLPFVFLYSFILSLLPQGEPVNTEQMIPQFELPPEATRSGGMPDWLEIVRNVIFWVVFISVMGYFVWQYIRQNQSWFAGIERSSIGSWFTNLWRGIKTWLLGKTKQIRAVIEERRKQADVRDSGISMRQLFARMRTEGLSPREKIIVQYNEMIKQGQEGGLKKKPAQTPIQYSQLLKDRLREEGEAVDSVTLAFLEARYTRHEINEDTVEGLEPIWKKIIRRIRGYKDGAT